MNKYNSVLGLGVDTFDDEPWLGSGSSTTSTVTPKKSITDTLSDWLGLAKQGADVFQTVRNKDGSVTYVPAPGNNLQVAQNNTMKYVLIGGGLALAATAVILLTRSGKKKLGAVTEKKAKRKKGK